MNEETIPDKTRVSPILHLSPSIPQDRSYYTLSYPIIPYHTLLYPIIPYYTLLYPYLSRKDGSYNDCERIFESLLLLRT